MFYTLHGHRALKQFQKDIVVVTVGETGFFILLYTFRVFLKVILLNYAKKFKFRRVNKSSGAIALQGLGRQSGRRRSAKLVPTFANRGVSRGQRNGSPRPLISVYRTWIPIYFIQVAPQLTSRGSRG
jgi:hypothetical protein